MWARSLDLGVQQATPSPTYWLWLPQRGPKQRELPARLAFTCARFVVMGAFSAWNGN